MPTNKRTEFKHTPGPWVADGDYVYAPDTDTAIHDCPDSFCCAFIGEAEANAQAIAAVPDLLAALQAQGDLVRLCWLRDNSYPEQGKTHSEWYDLAGRYASVFVEEDGWGWIIARMETHVREMRERALVKAKGETK